MLERFLKWEQYQLLKMVIEKYSHVMHIVSNVEGSKRKFKLY